MRQRAVAGLGESLAPETSQDPGVNEFVRGVVPKMAEVALRCEELFEAPLSVLGPGVEASCVFSQVQILCILCNAFFGTLLKQPAGDFPPVPNFRTLFPEGTLMPFYMVYFTQAVTRLKKLCKSKVAISVSRLVATAFPDWAASTVPLMAAVVVTKSTPMEISTCEGHVNFANERLGGHLYGGAVAQEEILCAFRPELCISTFVCARLQPNEAVVVRGARKWSAAAGYGRTVKCVALSQKDSSPATVLCMDAQYGARGRSKEDIDRDLGKAWLAFGAVNSVSTGRWGSGMFAKNPELTFLQQYAAASQRRLTALHYACFDNEAEYEDSQLFCAHVARTQMTVGQLYTAMLAWRDSTTTSLLDFVTAYSATTH